MAKLIVINPDADFDCPFHSQDNGTASDAGTWFSGDDKCSIGNLSSAGDRSCDCHGFMNKRCPLTDSVVTVVGGKPDVVGESECQL